MSIGKRVTYLKGLAEGLGLGKETKEERILQLMMELIEDIALEIDELKQIVHDLDDDVIDLAEGVQEIEDELYDEDELWQEEEDTCCNHHSHRAPRTVIQEAKAPKLVQTHAPAAAPTIAAVAPPLVRAPQLYAVNCPRCANELTVDEEILDEGFVDCPGCGERLEFDLED